MGEEKRILQIGGLAAMPAGIIWIIGAIGVAFLNVALTAEETVRLGTDIYAVVVYPGMAFLVALLLALLLFLALHRVSKGAGAARATLGATLGVSGSLLFVVSFAIGGQAWPVLADLYAGAPPEEQAIIVIAGEVVQQIDHALQLVGFLLIGLAFISFGWVLRARPDISQGYGWAGVIIGGLVALTGLVGLSGFPSALLVGGFGGTGVLFLLFGWKVYSLSRAA